MSVHYLKQKFAGNARSAFSSISPNDVDIIYNFLNYDTTTISNLKVVINNQTYFNQLIDEINTQLNLEYAVPNHLVNVVNNISNINCKYYLNHLSDSDINDLLDFLDYISQLK